LAKEVHTIERHDILTRRAERVLSDLGLNNVHIHTGDGSQGLPEFAPYQAVMVTAAAPSVPQPLLDQLDDGGGLVLPVGSLGGQILERWERRGSEYVRESIAPVAFVPLRGEYGWKDASW
jgi:protein-L-isoaspartate(D-aspartate) O-methyltransferase